MNRNILADFVGSRRESGGGISNISLVVRLKNELDAVERMNRTTQLSPSEEATRRSRHSVLARKLMGVIDKYRILERESQKRYRALRPNATDEEVAEAATNEASRSVFAMDVMSSYQSKVARRMLRDVENRDQDIREISNTIELLNGMFVEIQDLVYQQQDVLDNIEQAVESTHENVQEGNKMVDRAKWYRIKTRKKMWCFIFLVILIIIGIALGIALPVAM
ncbi:hypothetical protein IWW48_000912 [Coemansia sp. RSA 1200]|nr:hypothetical protein IWW48_000912 [Coemansia sp. RSA 1200]